MLSSLKRRRVGSEGPRIASAVDVMNSPQGSDIDIGSGIEVFNDELDITDRGIQEKMAQIHTHSVSLVGELSNSVSLDRYSWPHLADLKTDYPDCYDLFLVGLNFDIGVDNESLEPLPLHKVFADLRAKLDDLDIYVRTLVTGDVYRKVLIDDSLLGPLLYKDWIDEALAPKIEDLNDKLQAFVKSAVMEAMSTHPLTNTRLSSLPETLTGDLLCAMKPLLTHFLPDELPTMDQSKPAEDRWDKLVKLHTRRVMKIYEEAIALRKAMAKKRYSYSFFWITAGDHFNAAIMDAEVGQKRQEAYKSPTKTPQKVIATVLPGLCRHEGEDGIKRTMFCYAPQDEKQILVKALVCLGGGRKTVE